MKSRLSRNLTRIKPSDIKEPLPINNNVNNIESSDSSIISETISIDSIDSDNISISSSSSSSSSIVSVSLDSSINSDDNIVNINTMVPFSIINYNNVIPTFRLSPQPGNNITPFLEEDI